MISMRVWRSFFRKLSVAPKKPQSSRLRFEQMEDRVVPAIVTWTNPAGGYWDVGSNWSNGAGPGSGDTAVIHTSAAITVIVQPSDTIDVLNVVTGTNDTLSITGGSLTVTSGTSTLSGPLTMDGGSLTASGPGATFTADGTTTVTGTNLTANDGATLSLPQLTTYISDGIIADDSFSVDGTDSELDLSAMTSITQVAGATQIFALSATDGGTLNLSGLTSLNPGFGIIYDTGNSPMLFNSGLTSLTDTFVLLDAADAQIAANWTSLTDGGLMDLGGSVSLPNLTDLDGSGLYAANGGILSLPGLTTYNPVSYFTLVADFNGYELETNTWQAEGAGSELDLSNLTSVPPTGDSTNLTITATGGGTINLDGLTGLGNTSGATVTLTDTGGSTILDPNVTTLTAVDATFDGTDALAGDSWTSFSGSLILTGSASALTLPNLTTADFSSLQLDGGDTLDLPAAAVTLDGSVTLAPGSVLDVGGNLTLTSADTLDDQAAGPPASGQFGQVVVGGSAALGGAIDFDLVNGYTPTDNLDYPLITYASATSAFASVAGLPPGANYAQNGTAFDVTTPSQAPISIVVTDNQDSAQQNAGTGDPTDENGLVSLRSAVAAANVDAAAGESVSITFASELAGQTITLTQGQIELSGAGGPITIDGSSLSSPVTISGGNVTRVFQVDSGVQAVFSDFDISQGNATSQLFGGGIYNSGYLTVADVAITGGTANYGGGLSNSGTATLIDDSFSNNLGGGALFNTGTINASSCIFSSNSNSAFGGVIWEFGGVCTFTDCTFADNVSSGYGGAINVSPGTVMTVFGSRFISNSAENGNAGGAIENSGSLTVVNSTFTDNSASSGNGGAIDNNGGSIAVVGSTFDGNSAGGNGGAIDNESGIASVSASTFTSNTAAGSGGGIENQSTLTISSTTLSGDIASGSSNDIDDPGTLSVDGGTAVAADDISLEGTLTIQTNATLDISGDYTQTSTGVLEVAIGGTPASGSFGQLDISGTADLNGTFELELLDGYTPTGGQDYLAIEYASASGSFADVVGLPAGMTANQDPTEFDLYVPPTIVTWTSTSSGDWDDAANWSTDTVPGTGDEAIIDTAASVTVTISSGDDIDVLNVVTGTNDTLSITGGSLTVTSGTSTLSGPLTMDGGSLTASGPGATFTADGTTTVTGTNLTANDGATLSLPQLTTYISDGIIADDSFSVDGTDSELDLSAMTSITQVAGATQIFALSATDGGTLNLSGLTSLNPGFGIIYDTGNSPMLFNSGLTSLTDTFVLLDAADAQIAANWTSLTDGGLMDLGGSVSLPNLTDLDGSGLYAANGGILSLPGLTTYNPVSYFTLVADFNGYELETNTWQAEGAGSELDLSNLTSVPPTGDSTNLTITATGGGTINLDGLTGLGNTSGATVTLTDTGGSTIIDPNVTTLYNVDATLDGADPNVASSWTSFTGSLTLTGGTTTLPNLASADFSNLQVDAGAALDLAGNIMLTTGSLEGALTVETDATLAVVGSLTIAAGGSLDVLGTLDVEGTLTDNDNITIAAGGVEDVFGTLTEGSGGVQDVYGTLEIESGGSLDIFGSVTIEPGAGYTQLSAFTLEPGGTFNLLIVPTPTFSDLSSPSITAGAATTTISGTLDANAGNELVPDTETVQVTLDGVTQYAALDSNDNFSTTFDTSALAASGSPYTIAFSYTGDADFNSASAGSSLTVEPGTADPATSTVSVSPASVPPGSTTTVTLQAKNANGIDLTTGGSTVTFALGDGVGQGTFSAVTDNGNGTYTATFTGTTAGSNTIVATLNGQTVTSGSPTITVTSSSSSSASLSKSTVSVSSKTVQAGDSVSVTLQAKESNGEADTGSLTVAFALGDPSGGSQGTFSAVKDSGNGVYTATFTGTIAGSNTIVATIDGQTVESTAAITVTPGQVSLANSLLTLSAPSVQLGGVDTITLQARDAYGNDLTSGGLNVTFKLGSTSGGQGTLGKVIDNKNGTYTATFTGTVDGDNTIVATVEGSSGSATAPISITGAAFSASRSTLSASSTTIEAGSTTTITLQVEDAKGDKEMSGGLAVSFYVLPPWAGQGTLGPVVDHGNGTYSATFKGTIAGFDAIAASIDGKQVPSMVVIDVTPGPVSLKTSVVTVSSRTVQVGETVEVALQAEDAEGNHETGSGLNVAFALGSAGSGQGTFGPVVYVGNGLYIATFEGTTAGANNIVATINGLLVASTPGITVTTASGREPSQPPVYGYEQWFPCLFAPIPLTGGGGNGQCESETFFF